MQKKHLKKFTIYSSFSHVLCLGQRKFLKNIVCNWTSGYRWSTALILSITLGGFGADRFYLGHWQVNNVPDPVLVPSGFT